MKTALIRSKKNIRKIILLIDLISPIFLYQLLDSGKLLLSAVLFIAVILTRIIYVVIL